MAVTRLQERRSLSSSANGSPVPGLSPKSPSSNGHTPRRPAASTNGVGSHSKPSSNVPKLLENWIVFWLGFSAVVCAFDSIFTSWRPHTLPGGRHLYITVDHRYGDAKDSATLATGRCMWLEIVMNLVAITLVKRHNVHGVMLAFVSSVMTLWKTIVFLAMFILPPPGSKDYFSHNRGHPWRTLLIFWIPNCIWVVVPALVVLRLWNRLLPKQMACAAAYYRPSNGATPKDTKAH